MLVDPYGTEIPVQTRVERNAANRAFVLVWDGPGCGGSWSATLDGENESALQPIEPIKARLHDGLCVFVASVYGDTDGHKLLARTTFEVKACGSQQDCSSQR